MKVCAIVVTYNRLNLLKECLKRLLDQQYKLNNIVVVNNKSSDGTKGFLKKFKTEHSQVIVHNSNKNLGGAGGFSLGTKIAYEHTNSDYFWIMDDDTMTVPSSLDAIVTKARELSYDFGFLCSNVRWWKNHKAAVTNVPQIASDWNEILNKGMVKVTSTSFVSVLFSRKSVKRLGLPIGDMFIWGDDVEFTTRLSRNNDRSFLVDNSFVYHKSAVNKSYSILNSTRITFYKYGIRNKLYLYRKYYSFKLIAKKLLSCIYYLFKIPFYSKNKRLFRMYCVVVGMFSGLFFNPSIRFPEN